MMCTERWCCRTRFSNDAGSKRSPRASTTLSSLQCARAAGGRLAVAPARRAAGWALPASAVQHPQAIAAGAREDLPPVDHGSSTASRSLPAGRRQGSVARACAPRRRRRARAPVDTRAGHALNPRPPRPGPTLATLTPAMATLSPTRPTCADSRPGDSNRCPHPEEVGIIKVVSRRSRLPGHSPTGRRPAAAAAAAFRNIHIPGSEERPCRGPRATMIPSPWEVLPAEHPSRLTVSAGCGDGDKRSRPHLIITAVIIQKNAVP